MAEPYDYSDTFIDEKLEIATGTCKDCLFLAPFKDMLQCTNPLTGVNLMMIPITLDCASHRKRDLSNLENIRETR